MKSHLKDLRIHIKKSHIMKILIPKLIRDVLRNYTDEIIAPSVAEKVEFLIEKHDKDQEELRRQQSEAAKAKKTKEAELAETVKTENLNGETKFSEEQKFRLPSEDTNFDQNRLRNKSVESYYSGKFFIF